MGKLRHLGGRRRATTLPGALAWVLLVWTLLAWVLPAAAQSAAEDLRTQVLELAFGPALAQRTAALAAAEAAVSDVEAGGSIPVVVSDEVDDDVGGTASA